MDGINMLLALTTLMKYGDVEISVSHDEIHAGGDKAQPDTMSDLDVKTMGSIGWRWNGEYEGWSKFV